MDVFTELLPSNFQVKTKPSLKDKPKSQPRFNHQSGSNKTDMEDKTEPVTADISSTDRRLGLERRVMRESRGRWFESRERNDRRKEALEFTV